ncbi:MAG: DUF4369 domain-containing protein [Bacteroidales bacterium]|nr:DUF4369 domain-containing protein [Bacteroidales bacterium]
MKTKYIYILLVILIASVSCNKLTIFSSNTIKGNFTYYNDSVIYLVYENFKDGIITDTFLVENGKFKSELNLNDSETPVYLYNGEYKQIITLFMKNGDNVEISGSALPYQSVIEGDSVNIKIGEFYNANYNILAKSDSLKSKFLSCYNDSAYIKTLNENDSLILKSATQFVKDNFDSPASTFIIYKYIVSSKNKNLTKQLIDILTPQAKSFVISARIEHFAALQKFDAGKVLPYTELKSPKDSNEYSYTKKNKITLLLFWDSSDSISKNKIRELNSYYDTLSTKDKVALHAISLDMDLDNWRNTIKSEKFDFAQTRLKDGWNNKTIATINLKSVPSLFLLNRNGIILGRELELDSATTLIDNTIIRNDSIDNLRKNRNRRK